jgi:xanthine dehydrogenase accessory factor
VRSWIDDLAGLRDAGAAAVLVTVLTADGSTPRNAGTKMVVSASALFGTIGGGALEQRAIEQARSLIDGPAVAGPVMLDLPLGPELAQCCGGHVTLLLELFSPPQTALLLFGAGHVGREIAGVLDGLPTRLRWIDPRAHEFPQNPPANAELVVTSVPVAEVEAAPAGACFLVLTHSHDLDLEIVHAVLRRGDFGYLGLIGSKTKRARFVARLRARGIDDAMLERMRCPIGLPGIPGKHPREIAIGVAAELLSSGLLR